MILKLYLKNNTIVTQPVTHKRTGLNNLYNVF